MVCTSSYEPVPTTLKHGMRPAPDSNTPVRHLASYCCTAPRMQENTPCRCVIIRLTINLTLVIWRSPRVSCATAKSMACGDKPIICTTRINHTLSGSYRVPPPYGMWSDKRAKTEGRKKGYQLTVNLICTARASVKSRTSICSGYSRCCDHDAR